MIDGILGTIAGDDTVFVAQVKALPLKNQTIFGVE